MRAEVSDDDIPSTEFTLRLSADSVRGRESVSSTRLTVTAELDASPRAHDTEVTQSVSGATNEPTTNYPTIAPVTITRPGCTRTR